MSFAGAGDFPSIPGYRIDARIGAGANGEVYRAFDERLHRPVAIKVLHRFAAESAGRDSDLREGRALAMLSHPNVVSVHSVVATDDGRSALVMELVRGAPLDRRIADAGGRLPVPEVVRIATMVCRGLAHAHAAGLAHLDLKPANVLVGDDGVAKVADFGIARLQAGASEGSSLGIKGTPLYMAPEQFDDPLCSEPKADLYALGVMLFEMLAGRTPFASANPFQLATMHSVQLPAFLPEEIVAFPPGLRCIVLSLLEKKPESRPDSAEEVAAALGAAAGTPAIHETPVPAAPMPKARRALLPASKWVALPVGLLVVAATFVALHRGRVDDMATPEDAPVFRPVAGPRLIQKWSAADRGAEGVVFGSHRAQAIAVFEDCVLRKATPGVANLVVVAEPDPIEATCLAGAAGTELVAIGGFTGQVQIVSAIDGRVMRMIPAHKDRAVLDVAISLDGSMVASVGRDERVVVSDASSGRTLHEFDVKGQLYSVAWGEDASIYVSTLSGFVFSISLASGSVSEPSQLYTSSKRAASLQYVPGHRRLFSVGANGEVAFWDISSKEVAKRIKCCDSLSSGAYSLQARCVVAGDNSGTVYILDERENRLWLQERVHVGGPDPNQVDDIAVDPTGEFAASVGSDGSVAIWQLPLRDQEAPEPSISPASANEK